MTEALSHFPKLSVAAGRNREETNAEDTGLVLNGAKVVFDKEATLMPVTLQPVKKKNEDGKYN